MFVFPAEFMKSLCYVNRRYLHSEYMDEMEIYHKCIDWASCKKCASRKDRTAYYIDDSLFCLRFQENEEKEA